MTRGDADNIPIENLKWAIAARDRSQRLLLALYALGEQKGVAEPRPHAGTFSVLVGVAFSLWRAAFLADAPTRTGPEALDDARKLLKAVLRTNTISFGTEHSLQGWTAGYYLKNTKLRLEEILSGQVTPGFSNDEDLARVKKIVFYGTDPHVTWNSLCDEAERLAQQIGCTLSP